MKRFHVKESLKEINTSKASKAGKEAKAAAPHKLGIKINII